MSHRDKREHQMDDTDRQETVDELPKPVETDEQVLYFIKSNNVSYLTHCIHKFPSKFIPQIPKWAMAGYLPNLAGQSGSERAWILDPFCGSGTTLVEGLLHGHNVCGVDVDPVARLITKVKTTPIDGEKLDSACTQVGREVLSRQRGHFVPDLPTLSHWFNESAVADLSVIRDVVEQYRDDPDIYDFLLVTFSSIIRRASNADNQSQKTYVSHTNPKTAPPAKPLFLENLEKYAARVRELGDRIRADQEVWIPADADARTVAQTWTQRMTRPVDLAITSPPYVKALDYVYTQMAEYFWIGDLFGLQDQQSQNKYKERYIGTKQVYASTYKKRLNTGLQELDELVDRIYQRRRKHAYIAAKYFIDIRQNLAEVSQILRPGGHYVVVVGKCDVSGYSVDVPGFTAKLAESLGYRVIREFRYEIRNHYMRFPRNGRGGFIKIDHVLDLQWPGGGKWQVQ